MDSAAVIHLKCSSCDQAYAYQYAEYRAIEGEWREQQEHATLLETEPEVGKQYLFLLRPPLILDTDQPFWAVYLNPGSSLNGIETEVDLEAVRFCKCRTDHIRRVGPDSAQLGIEVLAVKRAGTLATDHRPDIQMKSLLDEGDTFSRYGTTENFPVYAYLDVSIQSDLGISAIVKKERRTSRIVAVNQWDFHFNEWIHCSIPLSPAEEKRFGIRHGS